MNTVLHRLTLGQKVCRRLVRARCVGDTTTVRLDVRFGQRAECWLLFTDRNNDNWLTWGQKNAHDRTGKSRVDAVFLRDLYGWPSV